MRAYCGHELGNLEAFALESVDTPTPADGELLISVEVTALGFVDQLVMRGLYQIKPPTPFVPGGEIVGTVEAVGQEVSGFAPGQRIAAWQFGGGLAEMAIVRQDHAVPVPADLEPAAAASLLLDYLTALLRVVRSRGPQTGAIALGHRSIRRRGRGGGPACQCRVSERDWLGFNR